MVWQVLEMLKTGATAKEIISAFPSLTTNHITSALDYASSLTREGYAVITTRPQISP